MKRFVTLLLVLGAVAVVMPQSAEAGMFCETHNSYCQPACCAAAPAYGTPTAMYGPQPYMSPRTAYFPKNYTCFMHAVLGHGKHAGHAVPAACCGGAPYAYGVATDGPHWF